MTTQSLPEGIRKAAVLVASLDPTTAEVLLARMAPRRPGGSGRRQAACRPSIPRSRKGCSWSSAAWDRRRNRPRRASNWTAIWRGGWPPQPASPKRLAALAMRSTAPSRGQGHHSRGRLEPQSEQSEAPFRFLRETEIDKLVKILANERPQVIALVLSHVPPQSAGAILSALAAADPGRRDPPADRPGRNRSGDAPRRSSRGSSAGSPSRSRCSGGAWPASPR